MVALFQWMLNWLRSIFFSKEMEISVVGLQNAGKTSLVSVIATENFKDNLLPTVGFNMRKVKKNSVTIKIWDLGGQPRFRSMWERYCRGVDAIVFVVDAANADHMDHARLELLDLISKPSVNGIPLLVLGNKNDLPGCLDEIRLSEKLELKAITDREIGVYSISCKKQNNLDITIDWLSNHAKH